MMSTSVRRIATASRRLLALSVLLVARDGWSITISPSPSYTGSYTVSFASTGCYTELRYYPAYVFQVCKTLQERAGTGAWTNVSTAHGATSLHFTGKASGTYAYQVYQTSVFGNQVVDGPASVTVGTPPPRDPLVTQLGYQFQTRQGDINADGRTDLFVKRTAGGAAGNGVLDAAILRQGATGGQFTVTAPTANESSVASRWPLSNARVVVTDFNVDGFVDVEVKGIAAATGVPAASDQIIFSSGLLSAPLRVRAVDAALKKFVGNTLDYLINPDYFHENADLALYYGTYPVYYCSFTDRSFSAIFDVNNDGITCRVHTVYVSGYYWDYRKFSSAAVAIWTNEESFASGAIDGAQSTERAQQTAEAELGVQIGGWPMEEELGTIGEHRDTAVRRGFETFWAILGIGRANAQEVETVEAPAQLPPTPNRIHIMTREIVGWYPGADHSALYHSTGGANIGEWFSASDTDGRPLVNGRLRAMNNWISDAPAFMMLVGEVAPPYFIGSGVFWETVIEPAHRNYWNYREADLLPYMFRPSNTSAEDYNSNGYIHGLVDYSEGVTDYDFAQLVGGETPVPHRIFSH